MADEITQQATVPEGISPEVHQMMQASLTGKIPESVTQTQQQETPSAANAVAETPISQENQEQLIDDSAYLMEHFGFKDLPTAKAEFERLKQASQVPQEFKFENEQSKVIAKALAAGKVQEVYQMLDEQLRIDKYLTSDITEDIAGDIIKLGLKLNHKDLTDAEIEYKYKKQYSIPKEPVLDVDDEDSVEKHNAWKELVEDIKMSKIIDAKLARPQLETAKTKLVLPDFENPVNEDYLQWQKLMEDQSKLDAQIMEEYKSITPKDVEFKMPFNDEANKIAFEFQYEPDAEGLKKSTDLASNIDNLLQSYISNGKFDKQAFLRDIHFGKNKEAIIMTAMNQAKNATIKASLPDNSGGGMNRQMPATHEPTELDKQMNIALAPYQQRNGRQLAN